jgi:ATP-dependent Zn protease
MKQTDDTFCKIEAADGLETRLEKLIDDLAEKEKRMENKKRQLRWWISGMVASITLLLLIGFFSNSDRRSMNQWTGQKNNLTQEQEIACLEAQKALVLISLNFNKGMDQLTLAVNKIEKSNSVINKTLKK